MLCPCVSKVNTSGKNAWIIIIYKKKNILHACQIVDSSIRYKIWSGFRTPSIFVEQNGSHVDSWNMYLPDIYCCAATRSHRIRGLPFNGRHLLLLLSPRTFFATISRTFRRCINIIIATITRPFYRGSICGRRRDLGGWRCGALGRRWRGIGWRGRWTRCAAACWCRCCCRVLDNNCDVCSVSAGAFLCVAEKIRYKFVFLGEYHLYKSPFPN